MEVPRRFTLDENSTVGSSVEAIQPTKILKKQTNLTILSTGFICDGCEGFLFIGIHKM